LQREDEAKTGQVFSEHGQFAFALPFIFQQGFLFAIVNKLSSFNKKDQHTKKNIFRKKFGKQGKCRREGLT
jgi:hypothetical protein